MIEQMETVQRIEMSAQFAVKLFSVFILLTEGVSLPRNLHDFRNASSHFDARHYYTHNEINEYLEDLNNLYPMQAIATTVGKSFEGRAIKSIRITNGDNRSGKSFILLESGSHGNEWIATAAALYIIDQLVEKQSKYADLLDNLEWIILPLVNPDGYEFSQKTVENRNWCKNRKALFYNGSVCYGTDINMNFNVHWSESGSCPNPCSNLYSGPSAFSESEALTVRNLIHTFAGRGLMYFSLHSFGSLILYPWAWTEQKAGAWRELHEVATAGSEAILKATGNRYSVGSYGKVLRQLGGSGMDYAYNAGFQYSYTMKLPAGSSMDYNIHPTNIADVVEEVWAGIYAMTNKTISKL